MPQLTDQTGYTLQLSAPAKRIISLVPSQTELLYDLGLNTEVIGITKFCVHPEEWFRTKQRVGGTKNPNLQLIRELQPDLILANKEENNKEHILHLRDQFPVYTSDISNIEENSEMIRHIALLINKKWESEKLIQEIKIRYHSPYFGFREDPEIQRKRGALYLIWREPWLSVGGDTFIHYMLNRAGFENCMAQETRYPTVDPANWQREHPAFILLSSEPYPFREKHIPELQQFFPDSKILLVNGEFFSWYGSRVVQAADYFTQLRVDIDKNRNV